MKKASIIIANYNDVKRVPRAIQSCLDQTWDNVEVVVVDDGSNDETKKVYEPFKDKIKLIELERKDINARTVSNAFNQGIKASTGDYIAILGADDYLDRNYVEKLIKLDTDIAFCNWRIIGFDNQDIHIEKVWEMDKPILGNFLNYNHLSHECMLCSREVVEKVGFYDERLPRSQDCDWIVRSSLLDFEWKHISDILVNVEKHEINQQKNYGSIYGKTLWSLKNNVNIRWILNLFKSGDVMGILAYYKAINDFINSPIWMDNYNNSEFKEYYIEFLKNLEEDISEL
jgi:glycosyltransferase involved in cell wall biosynthesis